MVSRPATADDADALTRAGEPAPSPSCSVCGQLRGGHVYVFANGVRCRRHALRHWPTVRRSLVLAAAIGTALFVINQLDVVISGDVTAGVIAKIALTYCVPFCVATFAALSNSRRSRGGSEG